MRLRLFLSVFVAAACANAFAVIAPFTEEALTRGLNYPMSAYPQPQGYVGQAVAFADLDGDGDQDIITMGKISGAPPNNGRIGIFENTGGGVFVDRSATSGIAGLRQMEGITAADYDADGKIDLYFTQHLFSNVLMRNLGSFAFSDQSTASGTKGGVTAHTAASWGDYNNDGWPDVYVCSYGEQ